MSGFLVVAYLVAGVLFIRSLGGLSKQETATQGNVFGIMGMSLAVVVTSVAWLNKQGVFADGLTGQLQGLGMLMGAAVVGGVIGGGLAKRVEMTGMPELVAMLHSFVGLAAVLVGFSSYLRPATVAADELRHHVHLGEIWVGIAVGAVTLTGSIIAWAKLKGSLSGKPLLLPGRHALNAVLALAIVGLAVPFLQAHGTDGLVYLLIMTGLASRAGRAPGDGHRRRGHAGRRLAAQQLLGLGGGGGGLHAQQRSADRHRRAGRLFGRHPLHHHVPGDEPVDPQRHLRRLRHRRGEAGRRARCAARGRGAAR